MDQRIIPLSCFINIIYYHKNNLKKMLEKRKSNFGCIYGVNVYLKKNPYFIFYKSLSEVQKMDIFKNVQIVYVKETFEKRVFFWPPKP